MENFALQASLFVTKNWTKKCAEINGVFYGGLCIWGRGLAAKFFSTLVPVQDFRNPNPNSNINSNPNSDPISWTGRKRENKISRAGAAAP